MKQVLLALLALYRWTVSPVLHALMPTGCRYQPSCSQYASEAVELHGARRGGWLALKRLLRCHPFATSGFDPVPMPESPASKPAIQTTLQALHEPLP